MTTLDGIINLNKPVGISSAQALYKIRAINNQRKSGHAGTLDPRASGVLILCLGRATKLVEMLMDQPKVYRTTARLDVTSESFDSDRPLIEVPVETVPSRSDIDEALRTFEGVVDQVPPKISAIKVKGVPAYKRVRRLQPVELAPRPVRIDWIHVHEYTWPVIDFEMCCGRGTYIRSVIRDLGVRLGTGGCLTSLVRKQIGPWIEQDAWTIERIESAKNPEDYLVGLERARELLQPDRVIIPKRPRIVGDIGTRQTVD